MRRFFVPDKEKCVAFLRAQKNVVEQNTTKGASPTGVLWNPTEGSAYNPVMRSTGVRHIIFYHILYYLYINNYLDHFITNTMT